MYEKHNFGLDSWGTVVRGFYVNLNFYIFFHNIYMLTYIIPGRVFFYINSILYNKTSALPD